MPISLKECYFEHTVLSIHFESFNDECAIVKEAQDTNLLSQESKLMRASFVEPQISHFANFTPCEELVPIFHFWEM